VASDILARVHDSADSFGAGDTPWRAVQQAAWAVLTKTREPRTKQKSTIVTGRIVSVNLNDDHSGVTARTDHRRGRRGLEAAGGLLDPDPDPPARAQ